MYGSRIREMRKRRGLTLKEVAEATGYTIGHISQIERDLKSPSLVALRKIQPGKLFRSMVDHG